MNNPKVLWLIAARANSKSIKNKNIIELNGAPLLSYPILSALNSDFPQEVWITTDSMVYADIAVKYGAKVHFIRPLELAQDDSSSVDVVLHAMTFANSQKYFFDFIGLLEPTSPFIHSAYLNKSISLLLSNEDADAIVAVKENRPNTLFIQDDDRFLQTIALNLNNLKKLGRQEFKKQITPAGGLYVSRWNQFLENKSFYTEKTMGVLIDDEDSVEIDEPIDLLYAKFLSQHKNNEQF